MDHCIIEKKLSDHCQLSGLVWFRVEGRNGRCRLDGPYRVLGAEDTVRGRILRVAVESTAGAPRIKQAERWVPFDEMGMAVFPGVA